jgi:hypothetical protein
LSSSTILEPKTWKRQWAFQLVVVFYHHVYNARYGKKWWQAHPCCCFLPWFHKKTRKWCRPCIHRHFLL